MAAILDDRAPPHAPPSRPRHWPASNEIEGSMEATGVPEGMGYLIIDVVAVVVLIAVLAWTYKCRNFRKGQ